MTPTLAKIEHVSLNEGPADNDNCEDAVIASGLVADNLYGYGGGAVGFTVSNFDEVEIYGNVRAVHELTICGIAVLEDTTAKGPRTWGAGLQGFEVRDALTSYRGATFNARLLLDMATGQEAADLLVSADDTTDTLTYLSAPVSIVTGTGVLYEVQLPDATTCIVGCRREIVNASPEFVGVKNSSSATWHRVPPRAKCVCYLLDNATAAGVWFSEVIESRDPSDGMSLFTDCTIDATSLAYSMEGIPLKILAVGAWACLGSSNNSSGGKQGTGVLQSGTTNAGLCCAYCTTGDGITEDGCRAVEILQSVSVLSDAVDEYIVRIGIGDNVLGGAHTNGVYFVYDRTTWGDFWVLRNIDALGNETEVTAVAVLAGTNGVTWQRLRLEISSDASRTDFWIDSVQVSPAGGLNTHVPGSVVSGMKIFNMDISKSVGTNNRYLKIDYARIQSYPKIRR